MENGVERNISKESVSKAITLSREISRIKVLDDKSPESDERARNFLKGNFSTQYENVTRMVELSKDPGRTENDPIKINAKKDLNLLGAAMLLAGQDKIEGWIVGGEVSSHVPSVFAEIETVLANNLLVSRKDDQTGKEIVTQLGILEKANRREAMAPNSYEETRERETKKTIDVLLDKYDNVDSDSEDAEKIGAVVGCLDGGLSKAAEKMAEGVNENDKNKNERSISINENGDVKENSNNVNEQVVVENIQKNHDSKEYRSPYEVTPESFVDALFNYDNPRLYFTPPPEWVKKLSSKEQYLLKIQMKLVNGAATKLAVKDISADKARQNEVYHFPTTELKYIYEMPYVREAMETFVGTLFEEYSEDGRKFLRLKQCRDIESVTLKEEDIKKGITLEIDKDGLVVKRDKNGYETHILDPLAAKRLGDIGMDYSFEDYKKEMFLTMALKKLYSEKKLRKELSSIDVIDLEWKSVYAKEIECHIEDYRVAQTRLPENKRQSKTPAELEYKWIVDNALEEKRAVATAWNFLFVGNIVESADIYRQLKPTQVNSDKIRTLMMPLEKFLQKLNIRKGLLRGTEESFGGSIFLWAKKRYEEEGEKFASKLITAADQDRDTLTDEKVKWRLFPKRVMCSFNDMYVVETEDKQTMTMSEALLSSYSEKNGEAKKKKTISFKEDDADVFVYLRDTWDEILTVNPFLIGKGEYSPVQQEDKFAAAVEKMKGLVTSIDKIQLTSKEIAKPENKDKSFGYEGFVDYPEYYAWLIANSVGLEMNLDIPVLNMVALKTDSDTYNDDVNNFVRLLNLDSSKSLKVKDILNGRSWLSAKSAIRGAKSRAVQRESIKKAEEKRKR